MLRSMCAAGSPVWGLELDVFPDLRQVSVCAGGRVCGWACRHERQHAWQAVRASVSAIHVYCLLTWPDAPGPGAVLAGRGPGQPPAGAQLPRGLSAGGWVVGRRGGGGGVRGLGRGRWGC